MKLTRISANGRPAVWVSSNAEAGKARKTFNSDGVPRNEITTVEYEFNSSKSGIIALLNGLEHAHTAS